MDQTRHYLLSIGAFATAAHLSVKALRLYDQLGILKPTRVDPDSGYRYYRSDQLATARLIRMLRQMEMPLAMIRRVLSCEPAEAAALIEEHHRLVEARVELIRKTARELLAFLNQEEVPMTWNIEVQDIPAQPVLSISRNVRIDDLDSHIGHSIRSLESLAGQAGGGAAGPPFGIYHGPVNAEDDGPIEVCLPVREIMPAGAGVRSYELPAVQAASVTVAGPQCQFPTIIEAYDALCQWMADHGYQPAGSPREIWLEGDQRMQIAWPLRTPGAG